MICRICNSKIENKIIASGVPVQVSVLSEIANSDLDKKDIDIYRCQMCDHIQIEYINNDNYYDDYLMQVSYSNQMNELQDREIQTLLKYNIKDDYFLEVGAGDGSFLNKVQKYYKKGIGYEPSKAFYNLCVEKNLDVINNYFPSEVHSNIKFDAFASRQVFEHLPNPKEVLNQIYQQLNFGAVGLIEIPNGKKILRDGRYFEIISDHVNYFTPRSLIYLIESCGFDVLNLKEEFYGDYLVVYVKKNGESPNIVEARLNDYMLINKLFSEHENIIVWGAGAKAFNFMTLLEDDSNVIKYVDGDKFKHGLYLPNASKKIGDIDVNIIDSNLIVIFASSYEKEIIMILKEMGFKNNIFSFITKSIHKISEFK